MADTINIMVVIDDIGFVKHANSMSANNINRTINFSSVQLK